MKQHNGSSAISRRAVLGHSTGVLGGLVAATAAGMVGDLSTPAAAAPPSTVFSDNFEAGDFSAWTRQRIDGNGTMGIAPDPRGGSSRVARFSVPCDGESYRSEVAVEPWGWGRFRYRWRDLIPSDWDMYQYGTIVAQWHGYPLVNGKDTRPPIQISVKEDRWQLKVHWLTDPTTVEEETYDLGEVGFGRWAHWDVRIDWSEAESSGGPVTHLGALTVRRDDALVARHEGENNYHQSKPPYFKLGLYRANWNPAKGIEYPTGGPDIVCYDDDVKVTRFPGAV